MANILSFENFSLNEGKKDKPSKENCEKVDSLYGEVKDICEGLKIIKPKYDYMGDFTEYTFYVEKDKDNRFRFGTIIYLEDKIVEEFFIDNFDEYKNVKSFNELKKLTLSKINSLKKVSKTEPTTKPTDKVQKFIDGLDIDKKGKIRLIKFVDNLLSKSDLDKQMDMVDQFVLGDYDDDILDEVDEFLRDLI